MKRLPRILVLLLLIALVSALCTSCKKHTEHIYDDACDALCNECEVTRVPPHAYENDCDKECNGCGQTRETSHVYDNDCDAVCNRCEAERAVGEHVYDHGCDEECNICGGVRDTAHAYDHGCDADCNDCGAVRETVHAYDHGCDTNCNNCGAVRETRHEFDNDCDTKCNVCGKSRAARHEYETPCDTKCSVCNAERVAYDHVYRGPCDTECGNCGALRVVDVMHTYTADCDPVCDACGAERATFRDHSCWYACGDRCSVCGENVEGEEHSYSAPCAEYCSSCYGPNPHVVHTYDNDSDTSCNVCSAVRSVPAQCSHAYACACDADCNLCGATRSGADHVYDNDCDEDCNACGAIRFPKPHAGYAKDGLCDVCGLALVSFTPAQDDRVEIADAVNAFFSNIHLLGRYSLFEGSYALADITVSGDLAQEAEIPYTYAAFYEDFVCYERAHAYCTKDNCVQKIWYANSDYGWYYLELAEGAWVSMTDMSSPYLSYASFNMLPEATVGDVRYYPEEGIIRLSDAYMKRLLTFWYYSGMQSSISIANSISISITDLMPYLSGGTMDTMIKLSSSGALQSVCISLRSPHGGTLYSIEYTQHAEGFDAYVIWGEDRMELHLTHMGDHKRIEYTLLRGEGENARDLSITASVHENLGEYAPDATLQQNMQQLEHQLYVRNTLAARYAGSFKRTSGTCTEIAVYDEEFGYYIYFYERNGVFTYRSYSPTLTQCCRATVDLAKKELNPTEHAPKEAQEIAMTARYDSLVATPDHACEAIAVYDEEYDTYAVFFMQLDGSYIYAGQTDLPSLLVYMCKGTINLQNGRITVTQHVHPVEEEEETEQEPEEQSQDEEK